MTLVAETCAKSNLRKRCAAGGQELASAMHTHNGLILVRWNSNLFVKHSNEIIRTEASNICQNPKGDVLLRMRFQPILYPPDRRVLSARIAK